MTFTDNHHRSHTYHHSTRLILNKTALIEGFTDKMDEAVMGIKRADGDTEMTTVGTTV